MGGRHNGLRQSLLYVCNDQLSSFSFCTTHFHRVDRNADINLPLCRHFSFFEIICCFAFRLKLQFPQHRRFAGGRVSGQVPSAAFLWMELSESPSPRAGCFTHPRVGTVNPDLGSSLPDVCN